MNTAEMHAVMSETQAGALTFPEAVHRLLQIGVESYFVDFAAARETLYLSDASTHVEPMTLAHPPISNRLSTQDLTAAIRHAQADHIRYPEFVRQATRAGVTAYWAYLTGQRVIYFGRQGEFHIEEFPRPQA